MQDKSPKLYNFKPEMSSRCTQNHKIQETIQQPSKRGRKKSTRNTKNGWNVSQQKAYEYKIIYQGVREKL